MSIQAGFIPSTHVQAEMSAQTLFTVPHLRLSYGNVKATLEFPFHQFKKSLKTQLQALDILDAGIKTVHCLHVSCLFCLN